MHKITILNDGVTYSLSGSRESVMHVFYNLATDCLMYDEMTITDSEGSVLGKVNDLVNNCTTI